MKKVTNKHRNQNNNSQYSLNYKFDSVSSAGKISGTALDLIKKYNELAKEALNNGNYTEMENFRQYAEHYRKIVTDINEKKTSFKPVPEVRAEIRTAENNQKDGSTEDSDEQPRLQTEVPADLSATTEAAVSSTIAEEKLLEAEIPEEKKTVTVRKTLGLKKELKIVEIKAEKKLSENENKTAEKSEEKPQKRVVRKKSKSAGDNDSPANKED
mgnify:CR=1 FL=1